ncbi:MAG TPA: TRAP transporter small permease [Desulfobacterales bacterium]|nr:MAG: TRAP transporter small permease [Deltaproteobacteria bacterium]HHC24172.1 TRAP transporter small permease [Desulfobacterales bacterium]
MQALDKITQFLNQVLLWIAGCFLVGMIVLTCANILLRIIWEPIRGTFELMGFFGAVVTAFALGYTQIRRGHIAVDVLINTFSEKTREALNLINSIICLLFFGIATWQIAKKATTLLTTGEVTETLRIIYYPFTYAVALGCALTALVFLVDLLRYPEKHDKKETK